MNKLAVFSIVVVDIGMVMLFGIRYNGSRILSLQKLSRKRLNLLLLSSHGAKP